ncbi:MAG: VWA domain-containing protein [Epsilonproteobacteria bacterium]|nr:VWA domain-containing protein [Campylobacterota bacterium]
MSHFSFEFPYLLGLIFIFIACAFFCKVKVRSIYFPHLEILGLYQYNSNKLLLILKWFGILMAIIALASPVLKEEFENIQKETRDIVLAIDASGSMLEPFDIRGINKFSVVKEIANDFIAKRVDDRVGIISFADVAFIASPLTFDKNFLNTIISMQEVGVAGQKTAINDGIIQAYGMVEKSNAKSKVVILLTDGIDNASAIPSNDVLDIISKSKVKLYTIGIGHEGDYDIEYLKKLSKESKAKSYEASNIEELEDIYNEIDNMEKSKIDDKTNIKTTYLFC